MLSFLKSTLEKIVTPNSNSPQNSNKENIHLAVAALFIESILIDNKRKAQEVNKVKNLLLKSYHIKPEALESLLENAEADLAEAVDYYQYTQLLNQHFDYNQKVQVVRELWQLALADNHLDSHEEHFIRKIADLLFVPHSEFIKSKIKAQSD
ncbi:tellurite resistance TerB family protein [Aliikangiella sp. IMCC44653]